MGRIQQLDIASAAVPRGAAARITGMAVASLALLLLLRGWLDDPALGVAFLLVIPVAAVSAAAGPRTGSALAVTAIVALLAQSELSGVHVPSPGYLTRGALLLSIPWLVWWMRSERRQGEGAAAGPGTRGGRGANGALTSRELEIVRLIALGHTNTEIAEQLYLSVRTVESHRARAQRKLEIRGRSQLVRYAFDNGLIGE